MEPVSPNSPQLIILAEKYWYKPLGLIISILLLFPILLGILFVFTPNSYIKILILSLPILALIIFWYFSRRVPKTKKNKIGFIVSILSESEEEKKRIREDFLLTLRELISQGEIGKSFHFIILPDHLSEKIIDQEIAHKIRLKSKAHFFIYGRVRVRRIDNKDFHLLNLEGVVSHNPIPRNLSNKLASEFTELLPRRVRIDCENDCLSFEFTSQWTNCVSKYIIGFAAALSSDFDYALQLFHDVQNNITNLDKNFPIYEKLNQRLPIRLAEIYEEKANSLLVLWEKNNNLTYINQIGILLENIDESCRTRYRYVILKSVFLFLHERNIDQAIAILRSCRKIENPIWHLNLSFLYAYKGDLKLAIQEYRNAMHYQIYTVTAAQVENFICRILNDEPNKYQLYYLLGFFNWQIKGDLLQAKEDLSNFLSKRGKDEFLIEFEFAQKWLKEIDEEIS